MDGRGAYVWDGMVYFAGIMDSMMGNSNGMLRARDLLNLDTVASVRIMM